ncbi:MAG: IclR family transcriptional regulator [Litoreibacter sp.]|nr:IclR family transcriptional regulator [Litoreibacter sp.]
MDNANSENPLSRRARGRPKAFHDKSEQNTIQSLDRAVLVLGHLAERGGIALSDLAKETDQSPATLYRILTTYQLHGVTEFDEAEQLWHIGPKAYLIGSAFLRRTSVVERSRPILRQLMHDTGETANLGVEQGDLVMFVSQVETHETIRAFFPPGTQSQMHASGIGKALLAHFSADRLEDWLSRQELERFTERTLTHPDDLLENLAQIRDSGLSFDNEERNIGMRCIAAPVFNAFREPVAGISVSGPISRMSDDRLEWLGDLVKKAAARATEAIGGEPPAS